MSKDQQIMSSSESDGGHHGIPEVVMRHMDKYVDSLAPQIQPRIASELEVFQQKTLDSLEEHVVDTFRSLFGKNKSDGGDASKSLDASRPDSYGRKSLSFADEVAKLTHGIGKLADEAGDDIHEIFSITEGKGDHHISLSHMAKGIFSGFSEDSKDQ